MTISIHSSPSIFFMSDVDQLTELLRTLPGVGPRQARRMAYSLIARDQSFRSRLSQTLLKIVESVSQCALCYRYYSKVSSSHDNLCDICTDQKTDMTQVMIVEKDVDLENIRSKGIYTGAFFVLGNLIPVATKKAVREARLNELLNRVHSHESTITEIILALSVNPDGEHTTDILRESLRKNISPDIIVSMLGRGLSTGTELEYSDSDTLKNALQNRK